MEYTQLTTKDLIGHTQNIIKEMEGKCHALELQIAMNRRLKAHYLNQKPQPNKAGAESARQAVARDATALLEMQIGMPELLVELAALQAQDTREDAEREAAQEAAKPDTEEASDDTVSDLDEAPIDLTDEAEPEPTPIKARTRRVAEAPASENHADARELVPV